jgi:hypothetical protein
LACKKGNHGNRWLTLVEKAAHQAEGASHVAALQQLAKLENRPCPRSPRHGRYCTRVNVLAGANVERELFDLTSTDPQVRPNELGEEPRHIRSERVAAARCLPS